MIGAHVGNWEIGVPFFDDYGKKINIVMYDAEHRRIKEILEKNGQDKDFKIIPVNEDNLTHVFRITEALNKKEYVCFQGDRYLNKEKLLTGTLLGQKAPFPAGPFLLGSRMKVPVVFYFAMREPGRTYRFHFIRTEPVIRTKEKKAEIALLEQYTAALDQILKRHPEKMSELLKEEKREQINKEKIIWLLTELNHTTENEVLKRYLFYNATESDDDIVEINNRLQAEIVNYIVYRNYGFNMESHSFPNLDNEVIRNMKITDKKEMLQNARKHADEVIQLINSQIYQLNKKEKSQTEGSVTKKENPVKDDKQGNITEKDISENPVRENIPSENGTSRNKIEDFGKKIGGARKDLWKDRGLDIVYSVEVYKGDLTDEKI